MTLEVDQETVALLGHWKLPTLKEFTVGVGGGVTVQLSVAVTLLDVATGPLPILLGALPDQSTFHML